MGWAAAIPAIIAVHKERTGANAAARQGRIDAAMGEPSRGLQQAPNTDGSSKLIELLGQGAMDKFGNKEKPQQTGSLQEDQEKLNKAAEAFKNQNYFGGK